MKSYNIRFPLVDDNNKNTFFQMNLITKDAFASDLLLLLLTEKGERYYDIKFGTKLLKYIFEPNDDLTGQDVEQDIKSTVSLYIPSLKILSVDFNKLTDENGNNISENQLNVHIKFNYTEDAFSENGELDLNF